MSAVSGPGVPDSRGPKSFPKRDRVLVAPTMQVGEELREEPRAEPEIAPSTERDVLPMTELLAAFGEAHTKLDLDLAYVEKLASAVFDRDAVSRAAAESVMLRSLEIAELRDALGRVAAAVEDPHVEELLAPSSALTAFVKMLYGWADAILGALIDFAASALRGSPAWAAYDARIIELAQIRIHALTEQIRVEAGAFGIFSEFGETLDELFWAAWYLHASMTKA